ncbi:MAG: AraC family transcriptional regulator [Clostridiales bacterium]|nr:AraC family transcriptional regulator [Clostridiales bacterium]
MYISGNTATPVGVDGQELVSHGTAAFPLVCYDCVYTDTALPWHWHDELEVNVVLEGTITFAVGGEKYAIRPGEGLFVNSGVLHAARNTEDGPCRLHTFVFHPRLVGGDTGSVFWQEYLSPLLAARSMEGVALRPGVSWQREALERIWRADTAIREEPPGYPFLVREGVSWLMYLLLAHQPAQPQPSEKAQRDAQRVKTMLQYIQNHYADSITVDQIARSASLSASECLRCFHATIGSTPIQYVKQLRVQQAAVLLTTTDQKVADIGAQCGFQETSYFSRAFRSMQGCTPSEYRRRLG